jgi:hypothetical protein
MRTQNSYSEHYSVSEKSSINAYMTQHKYIAYFPPVGTLRVVGRGVLHFSRNAVWSFCSGSVIGPFVHKELNAFAPSGA